MAGVRAENSRLEEKKEAEFQPRKEMQGSRGVQEIESCTGWSRLLGAGR